MVNMNGVGLQSMTYNGVEVQTWTHDGVEVYSASKPWIAIDDTGTLYSPCVKPVVMTGTNPVYYQGTDIGYETYGSGGIVTKNEDGTNFIPTNRCKYMKFRISTQLGGKGLLFDLTGKKSDGVEELINTFTTNGGPELAYHVYKNYVDIDVSGYVSVKLGNRTDTAAYAGIAYIEFYN